MNEEAIKIIQEQYITLMYKTVNNKLKEISMGSDPNVREKATYYEEELKKRLKLEIPVLNSFIEYDKTFAILYSIPEWRLAKDNKVIDIFNENKEMEYNINKKRIVWQDYQKNIILSTYKNKFIEYTIYYNYHDLEDKTLNIPFSLIEKKNDKSTLLSASDDLEQLKQIAQLNLDNFLITFIEEMQ